MNITSNFMCKHNDSSCYSIPKRVTEESEGMNTLNLMIGLGRFEFDFLQFMDNIIRWTVKVDLIY